MNFKFKSKDLEETEKLATKLASVIKAPALILFDGGMGAGKTTFVNAFAKAYGSEDETSSPTFSIINTYNSNKGPIHHLDLYRLADPDELYMIGFEDIRDENSVILIEWPEIAYLDNEADYMIKIELDEENNRIFTIISDDENLAKLDIGE